MSNNKDFLVNGPVSVGKDTKVTVGSIAAGTVDLSTGNYFTDTPTGDYTYTFANPGDVQSFQIQATGGSEAAAETFSTTLYAGTSPSTQTITNGIDLAGDGGLVWLKSRTEAQGHSLFDTERGANELLISDLTAGSQTVSNRGVTSFNSDGFDLGGGTGGNRVSNDYVSWTFKKQAKFFDVVTYTGNGVAGLTVSHNLGSVPGMIIVKCTSATGDWETYHRGVDATAPEDYVLKLNQVDAREDLVNRWNDTAPTSTHFTLGSNGNVNADGFTYVAYLFAHDTASDGLIQCGSYTGNGSTTGPEINLGWQPQWLLIKNASGVSNWLMVDNIRGFPVGSDNARLFANLSNAEVSFNGIDPTATGFKLVNSTGGYNTSGNDYIYMAIRSASAPAITWPTNIEWPAGITPSTPAEGETDVFTFTTDDGGTTYTGVKSIDNAS